MLSIQENEMSARIVELCEEDLSYVAGGEDKGRNRRGGRLVVSIDEWSVEYSNGCWESGNSRTSIGGCPATPVNNPNPAKEPIQMSSEMFFPTKENNTPPVASKVNAEGRVKNRTSSK
jgi:hypothetical protein